MEIWESLAFMDHMTSKCRSTPYYFSEFAVCRDRMEGKELPPHVHALIVGDHLLPIYCVRPEEVVHARNVIAFFVWAWPSGFCD